MCKFEIKKGNESAQINAGKVNASEINCMAIGTDNLKLNHEFASVEIGDYEGQTVDADCGNCILHFKGGILVGIEVKK